MDGPICVQVLGFQSRAESSQPPVTMVVPSGLKAIAQIGACIRMEGKSGLHVAASHNVAMWSQVAVSTFLPSGLNATRSTTLVCVRGAPNGLPVFVFQSRAVWS